MVLEIISTLLFIVFLVFELKQHIACWPIGIVSSMIYIYTQWQANLYGMTALAVFLVLSSIWGWYQWGKDHSDSKHAHYGTKHEYIIYGITSLIMLGIANKLLIYFGSTSPRFESLIFTLNIIGTFLMGRKSMLAWIAFFLSNILCIPMYILSDHYVYAGLYVIYASAAILGWVTWTKLIVQKS